MQLSDETLTAIRNMRKCQETEESFREAAQTRFKEAKEAYRKAYAKTTNRSTLGNLEYTINRRAQEDPQRKDLVGDEQFYRGLTQMYAAVAQVELALDEARDREQSTVSNSRTRQI